MHGLLAAASAARPGCCLARSVSKPSQASQHVVWLFATPQDYNRSVLTTLTIQNVAANAGAWASYPVTVAVAIFIGGAEGALLTLLPLTFNDGQKIWKWNPLVWLAIALPATFLFVHVIVNEEDYSALTEGTSVPMLMIVSGVLYSVAAGTWFFFRWRNSRREHAAE